MVFASQNNFVPQMSQIWSEVTPGLEPVYIKNFKVGVACLISSAFLKKNKVKNNYTAQNVQLARFPRSLFKPGSQ